MLLRPFRPTTDDISRRIVARVMALPEEQVIKLLGQVLGEFADRHVQAENVFRKRYTQVLMYLDPGVLPSPERQMLIGAYFTHEYSPESAALFNPSIVPHPDQSGLPKGALRFILSLRATGEGHISSITFRTGTISTHHRITLTPPVPFVTEPERVPNAAYAKGLESEAFWLKIKPASFALLWPDAGPTPPKLRLVFGVVCNWPVPCERLGRFASIRIVT